MTIFELFEILGIDDKPDPWFYISLMIDNSTFEEDTKESMHSYNNDNTAPELMEVMLRMLYDSQRDNIDGGFSYNMGDIHRKLKRL